MPDKSANKRIVNGVKEIFKTNQLIERHEVADLSDNEFRNEINRLLNIKLSKIDFDKIWNALLLDIPPQRIALLETLKSKYRLFLLSNTNSIHFPVVEHILASSSSYTRFESLFEKVYLSQELKLRKPHASIYQYVLNDSEILPHETLFIDDNKDNIDGATTLGIQTFHLQLPEQELIFELSKYDLL